MAGPRRTGGRKKEDATIRQRENKKSRFLTYLAKGFSISYAANHSGAGRSSIYEWRDLDAKFAEKWDKALEEGADWYEDKLREQADDGNVTAIIVGLKMKNRFVERHEVTGKDGETLPAPIVTTQNAVLITEPSRLREVVGILQEAGALDVIEAPRVGQADGDITRSP